MQHATTTRPESAAGIDVRRAAAAAVGIALGVFLLYGVGFAAPSAIHNAAHDTRHAFAFPCH